MTFRWNSGDQEVRHTGYELTFDANQWLEAGDPP